VSNPAAASELPRILCVDDEPYVLRGLQRSLRNHFEVVTAESGEQALELLSAEEPFQVIPPEQERPWLARWTPWVIGLVVLFVIALVWWLRRQRPDDDLVQEITEEAEGILRALGDLNDGAEDAPPQDDNIVSMGSFKPAAARQDEEEAVELDADDPETKLDLARAYLSMGDLGAARRILEEVLDNGDEEQVAEARRMMQEL